MRYQVRGADRESGELAERVIEAADESDARTQARGFGLMIETIAVLGVADADADAGAGAEAGEATGRYTVRVLDTSVQHGQGASAIRSRLEALLNSLAAEGWAFVSVQSVPAVTRAGHHSRGRITAEDVPADVCLAVFRRETPPPPA